jgi:hypothetical protein
MNIKGVYLPKHLLRFVVLSTNTFAEIIGPYGANA